MFKFKKIIRLAPNRFGKIVNYRNKWDNEQLWVVKKSLHYIDKLVGTKTFHGVVVYQLKDLLRCLGSDSFNNTKVSSLSFALIQSSTNVDYRQYSRLNPLKNNPSLLMKRFVKTVQFCIDRNEWNAPLPDTENVLNNVVKGYKWMRSVVGTRQQSLDRGEEINKSSSCHCHSQHCSRAN